MTDEVSSNLIIANYNSMAALDTDDGSAYFDVHNNFFSFAPFALKSDIGGHGKTFRDNVLFIENLFGQWNCGPYGLWFFLTQPQVEGAQDAFFDNHLVQIADGVYAAGQLCNSSSPAPGSGGGYTNYPGFLPSGDDVLPSGAYTLLAAQALCNETAACKGITFASDDPDPPGTIAKVYFKSTTNPSGSGWWSYINNERTPPSSPGGVTILHNNSVYTPNASIEECGMPLSTWQALSPYNDPLTTANLLPAPERILELARIVLGAPQPHASSKGVS